MSSIKAEGENVPDAVSEPIPVVTTFSSDPTLIATINTASTPAQPVLPPQGPSPALTGSFGSTSTILESTLPTSQTSFTPPLPPPALVAVVPPPMTTATVTATETPPPATPTQTKPHAGTNGTATATATATATTSNVHSPATLNGLERGPLGLAPDEEEWVRDKMEYALHDFQVLSLAIKRYRWQLGQVPKDISRLQSLKEIHMEDPFEFLRQVKSKEFRYPEGQKTLPAPSIEWTKFQFPPANPVIPTKPQPATFLNAMSGSNSIYRSSGSNIVSLARSNQSRAGSPSYERMRAVKDTARSLGIHVSHHSHYQHQYSSQQYRHDSVMATGTNGVDEFAGGGATHDIDAFSRQPSQEVSQPGIGGHSQSPSVAPKAQDMEGVTYTSQDQLASGFRARSVAISESTSAPNGGASSIYPATVASSSSMTHQYIAPNNFATFEPTPGGPANITISHTPGFTSAHHTSFSTSGNNNITYNHMSGSVDIQPGNTKGKGYSREGSGVRDDPKPPLYNIPWSDEEQRLLEKLLDEYPDEPVAAQRFQKISAAMGTRTPKQVASRVQKYFIKLVKAGLEAPGRMNYSLETSKAKTKGATPTAKGKKRKDGPGGEGTPKGKAGRPRKKDANETIASGSGAAGGGGSTKKQKPKSLLGSGSGRTSGTQYLHYSSAPTVYMSEEDDEDSVQDMLAASHSASSVPGGGIASHVGFSCDSCGVDPIMGIRYSCIDCEELGGTDLCGPCYNSGVYHNELHLLSHRFHAIETSEVPSYSHSQPYRPASVGPSGTSGIYQP